MSVTNLPDETAVDPQYRLLEAFAGLFRGTIYNHRVSTNGDRVILELYEDLLNLRRSSLLAERITGSTHVVNTIQRVHGKIKRVRRGDGTFGELVPSEEPTSAPGYQVPRGPTATLEIGAECKIICVAQGRQIDRVVNDLEAQHTAFKHNNPHAITVAVVGINRAPRYRSIEGAKKPRSEWRITETDGRGSTLHPAQEADNTIAALKRNVGHKYDEFVILEFLATNDEPLDFNWVDPAECRRLYSSSLTRIAREYTRRFRD